MVRRSEQCLIPGATGMDGWSRGQAWWAAPPLPIWQSLWSAVSYQQSIYQYFGALLEDFTTFALSHFRILCEGLFCRACLGDTKGVAARNTRRSVDFPKGIHKGILIQVALHD